MATTKSEAVSSSRKSILWIVLGILITAPIVMIIVRLNRPPQMGVDEDVFHTVDALFTAVTARDEGRLRECEQRLHAYRDDGKLPKKTCDYLDGVIAKARHGDWESSAKKLYDFMLAQRR